MLLLLLQLGEMETIEMETVRRGAKEESAQARIVCRVAVRQEGGCVERGGVGGKADREANVEAVRK
jgi:hypothetical protein